MRCSSGQAVLPHVAYVLIGAVLSGAPQTVGVRAFLTPDCLAMTDRFKAAQLPKLREYVAYLAVLSEPRPSSAVWGLQDVIS